MPANPPESCVNRVEKMLRMMGANNVVRRGDSRLEVKFRTISGKRYTLHFYFQQGNVVIESYVFKGVSGKPANLDLFQKTLLAYNGSVNRIYFGLVPLSNEELGVVLRAAQNCNVITARDLKDLLDYFHAAFTFQIPRLTEAANELGLNFDGKGPSHLRDFLSHILGDE